MLTENKFEIRAPVRFDFAGGWTDIPFLIKHMSFKDEDFGYTTNVALSPLVRLIDGEVDMGGFPRGCGLSSSTAVEFIKLVQSNGGGEYLHNVVDLKEIAESLFRHENRSLNWAIGRQDMYAVVYGGLHCWKFSLDDAEALDLKISKQTLGTLENRLLLFFTGTTREAQLVVEEVYRNYSSGEKVYRDALNTIARCGLVVARSLEGRDFDSFKGYIVENWEAQKILAPTTSIEYIDMIHTFALENGGYGKLGGAGRGGCFMFYSENPVDLGEKLIRRFPDGAILPFKFEYRNVKEINSTNPNDF